ncbi:hypothetical protein ACTMTF_43115 [Nonomuraea sp. ZG12]|uniref:hypothetical protein n=1 Tax=Nonomuraea sp. ZG12 TaxID=3452207 RepID=UPI003F8BD6AB
MASTIHRERARELMKAQGGFAAASADLILGFVEYSGDAATGDDDYADQDWSALMRVWPDVEQATGHPRAATPNGPATTSPASADHHRPAWASPPLERDARLRTVWEPL